MNVGVRMMYANNILRRKEEEEEGEKKGRDGGAAPLAWSGARAGHWRQRFQNVMVEQ